MTPKTLTCVLVDDEQSNLDVLVTYVNQIPYLLLKATFVKSIEALAYLLKNSTDLLITDINMPRLSGIDLYESLRDSVFIQVIFVSGYTDSIVEALEHSVTDYLHKPVSFTRFNQAIQKVVSIAIGISQKMYDDVSIEYLEIALKCYDDLSETEKKVLALIAEGNSTKKMADLLFTSPRTVDSHRLAIRKKLKLLPENSLTQIAKFIIESIK